MALSEKVRLEIGVSDHFVQPTVQAILRGASTGTVGDGKIFVLPVEKIYRIRTAEEDEAAVTPVTVAKTQEVAFRSGSNKRPVGLTAHRAFHFPAGCSEGSALGAGRLRPRRR